MSRLKLKPCPFCGGGGIFIGAREECDGLFIRARVECPECGIDIVGDNRQTTTGWATDSDYDNSNKTAIEKWNRRITHEAN